MAPLPGRLATELLCNDLFVYVNILGNDTSVFARPVPLSDLLGFCYDINLDLFDCKFVMNILEQQYWPDCFYPRMIETQKLKSVNFGEESTFFGPSILPSSPHGSRAWFPICHTRRKCSKKKLPTTVCPGQVMERLWNSRGIKPINENDTIFEWKQHRSMKMSHQQMWSPT